MENEVVLIIGNGAREHAISHAYEKSPKVKKIIVSPGNDFISYKRKKEVIVDKDVSLKGGTTATIYTSQEFLDLNKDF